MSDKPQFELQHMDDATIQLVTRNLRGVQSANVRFYHTDKRFEEEFIALMLALEISTDTTRIERIAPPPRRRFSFQFAGSKATITVAPNEPLLG